ncbi:MAG: FtsW/RodA/SpoVE family cell cycle protein [Planctomycetota bacterium]
MSTSHMRWFAVDWHILVLSMLLLGIGMLFLSAMDGAEMEELRGAGGVHFAGHREKVLFTLPLVVIGMLLRPSWIKRHAALLYSGSIALLVLVMLVGNERNHARRWIQLPKFDLQPSELAKLGLILMLAKLLSGNRLERPRDWLAPLAAAGLPMLLVAGQPDLGTAMTLVPITLGLLYLAGGSGKVITGMVLAGVLFGGTARQMGLVQDYQWKRVQTWAATFEADNLIEMRKCRFGVPTSTWRVRRSGTGTCGGRAGRRGVANRVGHLPERDSDSVFRGDRRGVRILGASLLLVLYTALVLFPAASAARLRDRFARLTVGASRSTAAHVFIHVAVNVGLLPMTGLTLPLISAGGSSLLTTFLALGLALGLGGLARAQLLDQDSFHEFPDVRAAIGLAAPAQGRGLGVAGLFGLVLMAYLALPLWVNRIAGSSPCSSLVGEPLSAPTQAWLDARLAGLRGKDLDRRARAARGARDRQRLGEVHGHWLESRLHPGRRHTTVTCRRVAWGQAIPMGRSGRICSPCAGPCRWTCACTCSASTIPEGRAPGPIGRRPCSGCPMGSCMRRWQAAAKASCPRLRSIRTIPEAIARLEQAQAHGARLINGCRRPRVSTRRTRVSMTTTRPPRASRPGVARALRRRTRGADSPRAWARQSAAAAARARCGRAHVVAHQASSGMGEDLDHPGAAPVPNHRLLLRLMDEPRYGQQLFADISTLTQWKPLPAGPRGLPGPGDLHGRLLQGSDWPLPAIDAVQPRGLGAGRSWTGRPGLAGTHTSNPCCSTWR